MFYRWFLIINWTVLGIIAIIATALWGRSYGLSALAGGAVVNISSAYLAFRVFRHKGARQAKQIMRTFYRAVAGKFIIAVALLAVLFSQLVIVGVAFFVTMGLMLMINGLVPLFLQKRLYELARPSK